MDGHIDDYPTLTVQTTKTHRRRTQVMDENIQQNPNENGTRVFETRFGQ